MDAAQLRGAGLSWRKIGTLRDLAGRLTDGRLDQQVLSSLPDDDLMAELFLRRRAGRGTASRLAGAVFHVR